VPQKGVATDLLAVVFGEFREGVGVGEGELTAVGWGRMSVEGEMGDGWFKYVRSVASHFMEFSGVTWPKSALMTLALGVLLTVRDCQHFFKRLGSIYIPV
jgi:hypothetical protein